MPDANPWDLRALYRAHVTLAREDERGVLGEERFSRGGGVAGHDPDAREVWLDHWQLSYGQGAEEDTLIMSASVKDVPIRLVLRPTKSAIQADADGTAPARGFSISRMSVEGEIGLGEVSTQVSGEAWLDRIWGELPLPGGPLAYDRLALQLEDGTDLSLVRTRRRDRPGSATVEGFIVGELGQTTTVADGDLDMVPTAHWRASRNGSEYPVAWRVSGRGLDLRISPLIEDQTYDFAVRGWNGIVQVEGTSGAVPVKGRGTLQLTGYEER